MKSALFTCSQSHLQLVEQLAETKLRERRCRYGNTGTVGIGTNGPCMKSAVLEVNGERFADEAESYKMKGVHPL